jgi:hypothetical protein
MRRLPCSLPLLRALLPHVSGPALSSNCQDREVSESLRLSAVLQAEPLDAIIYSVACLCRMTSNRPRAFKSIRGKALSNTPGPSVGISIFHEGSFFVTLSVHVERGFFHFSVTVKLCWTRTSVDRRGRPPVSHVQPRDFMHRTRVRKAREQLLPARPCVFEAR